MAPLRPIPDTAFGFVLDDPFRRRWAQAIIDKDPEMARESRDPQKSESLLSSAMVVMTSVVPEDVYDAVPGLPRLYRYLLPMKEPRVLVPRIYVFVLQEHKGTLPPTPENVKLVRKALGLREDQEPAWVSIDRLYGPTVMTCVLAMLYVENAVVESIQKWLCTRKLCTRKPIVDG